MQFKEVVGQSLAKNSLLAAVHENRVSHTLLFHGPKGCGVLSLALAFAQYLNCENPLPNDSCGVCGSCNRSAKMIHPDIHYSFPIVTSSEIKKPKSLDYISEFRSEVLNNPFLELSDWVDVLNDGESKTKQGFISVEEANDIIRKISLKSFEGKFKILIMWLPEMMRQDTANKLLKSLEEPPDSTIFILACEDRDYLLPTIVSRTQLIKLKKLNDEELYKGLKIYTDLDNSVINKLVFLSDGNMAEALAIAQVGVAESSHEVSFLNWMRLCFNPIKTMDVLLAWVDEMAGESKENQKHFLNSCIKMVRECILLNSGSKSLVKLEAHQQASLERFLPFVTILNAPMLMKSLDEAIYHLERNAYAKILFLDLSLKMSDYLQKSKIIKAV